MVSVMLITMTITMVLVY